MNRVGIVHDGNSGSSGVDSGAGDAVGDGVGADSVGVGVGDGEGEGMGTFAMPTGFISG